MTGMADTLKYFEETLVIFNNTLTRLDELTPRLASLVDRMEGVVSRLERIVGVGEAVVAPLAATESAVRGVLGALRGASRRRRERSGYPAGRAATHQPLLRSNTSATVAQQHISHCCAAPTPTRSWSAECRAA
jgi:hypothetical protein